MNAGLYLGGIVLQALAAMLALWQVRTAPRRLAWLLIALASLLIVVRRLSTLEENLKGGHPLSSGEVLTVLISMLFFLGVLQMSRLFKDIQESRSRREAAEAQQRRLFEQLPYGVVYQDAQGAIVSANPAAERILGLSLDQMQGRTSIDPCWQSLHEDGSPFPGDQHPAMEALRTGVPLVNVTMGVHNPALGQTQWIHVSSVPYTPPGAGAPQEVCTTFVDITDRKLAEDALRLSEARLDQAFDASPIGMALVALDGTFFRVNQALCDMLGKTPEALVGTTFQSITAPEDQGVSKLAVGRLLAGEISHLRLEKRYIHACGWELWGEVSVSMVKEASGEPVHLVAQIQDISARRLAEQQRVLTVEILEILNRYEHTQVLAAQILDVLQRELNVEALGMRLAQEGDFPYMAHRGFPESFIQQENTLVVQADEVTSQAEPQDACPLACLCGQVLSGTVDPDAPLFTPGGSAWTNDAQVLWGQGTEQHLGVCARRTCVRNGYRSLALIPIRAQEGILGLLQLVDARPNCFTPELIVFLEGICISIGLAMARNQARERLETSLEHLRIAHAAARAGHWEWDLRSQQHVWSDELFRLYGLEPGSMPPSFENWMKALHPDDRAQAEGYLKAAVEVGRDLECEWRVVLPEGSIRWLMFRAVSLKGEQGQVLRYLGIAMDITARKDAEQALRQTLQTSADLVEALPSGLLIYAYQPPDQLVLRSGNPEAERLTGLHVADWVGRPFDAIWPMARATGITEAYLSVVRTGHIFETDELAYEDDQIAGAFRIRAFPLPGELLAVAFDNITERKRAEETVRRQAEELDLFFRTNLDLLCVADLRGRLVRVNPEWERVLGHPITALVGADFMDYVHPDDAEATRGAFRYLLGDDEVAAFINRFRCRDGSYRWLEWKGARSGEWIHGAARDITDRRLVEEALKASEEQYRLLVENSNDIIYTVTMEGVFTYVSPSWTKKLGHAVSDIIGHPFMPLIHPDDLPSCLNFMHRTLAGTQGPSEVEYRVQHADGSWRWHRSNVQILRNAEGKAMGLQGTASDISERKQAEETERQLTAQLYQSQKMESLGSLAGGVAHDLNNVLGAVLSLASALRARVEPPDAVATSMDTIIKACTRGRDVVKSLLMFARKDLEEVRPMDLNAMVREVAELLSHTTLKRVDLALDLQEGLPEVLGDESALSHAVINLCVNAVDAMPDGGTLILATRRLDDGCVTVRVQDTGCGMSAEVLTKATEPFFTTKPAGKGTGLGLAMVYGTVKAHEGTLEIHSQPGRGTEIVLTFPGRAMPSATQALGLPTTQANTALRVLLVDDDDLTLASVATMLEVLGHEVHQAPSGVEALRMLGEGLAPDLVLLDMNMPGMGGAETLAQIRALHGDLPVLVTTGYADVRVQRIQEAFPKVGCLLKPYTLSEIQLAIHRFRNT